MEIKNGETTYDVTDYVEACDPIPITNRNKNWEPVISEFNMEIVNKIIFTPAEGDEVYFYVDENVRFSGKINSVKPNYGESRYVINVVQDLNNLLIYDMDYNTHYTEMTTDTTDIEFRKPDNQIHYYGGELVELGNFQILYLIKKMFEIGGLTLDTSYCEDAVVAGTDVDGTWHNFAVKHFAVDEGAIFSLGQDQVVMPVDIPDDINLIDKQPTFWDIIQILCGFLTLRIQTTGKKTYRLIYAGQLSELALDDDYKYENMPETMKAKYKSLTMNNGATTARWEYYRESSHTAEFNLPYDIVTPTVDFYNAGDKTAVKWINGLVCLLRDTRGSANDGDLLFPDDDPSGYSPCFTMPYEAVELSYEYFNNTDFIREPIKDQTITKIITGYKDDGGSTNYNVLSNKIDTEVSESIIELIEIAE
ncbi:MAG: hypothetical protein A2V66_03730 [Ignavibacteria bacterium RBG_13_36_8]|nr:MAG: hypothetical protein A2V66_03730 [Ignavibacteria bacterium RBG_13_36_8]